MRGKVPRMGGRVMSSMRHGKCLKLYPCVCMKWPQRVIGRAAHVQQRRYFVVAVLETRRAICASCDSTVRGRADVRLSLMHSTS